MRWLPFLIAAAAGGLIVAGVWLIYMPAALITAGVLLMAVLFADFD